jgi:hypothetical protein
MHLIFNVLLIRLIDQIESHECAPLVSGNKETKYPEKHRHMAQQKLVMAAPKKIPLLPIILATPDMMYRLPRDAKRDCGGGGTQCSG